MWPFEDEKTWSRLAGGGSADPFHVSVITRLVSPSSVVSPFTGMRAGILHVELLERMPDSNDPHARNAAVTPRYDSLGALVLGDVVTLRDEAGDAIDILVRRASIQPASSRGGGTPVGRMPAELVPLLRRATGRGVLCYRELTLSAGDTLRLRAVVEPSRRIVAEGSRSGVRVTYVARDDLAPVVLEEVSDVSAW
jgi:hypothetical protein